MCQVEFSGESISNHVSEAAGLEQMAHKLVHEAELLPPYMHCALKRCRCNKCVNCFGAFSFCFELTLTDLMWSVENWAVLNPTRLE